MKRFEHSIAFRELADRQESWRHIDSRIHKLSGGEEHEALQCLLDRGGPMKRSTPWEDRHEMAKAAATEDEDVSHAQPLSTIFHDKSSEITGRFDGPSITGKTKEQTRGLPTPAEEVAEAADEPSPQPAQELLLNKRAYKVFRALFFTPGENESSSTLDFTDLVAAMQYVGFSAEQTQGSQWQFNSSPEMNLTRGIGFHAPHPGNEVSPHIARRIGRRLNRAYGWEGWMFKKR